MHTGNERDDDRDEAHITLDQAGLGEGRRPVPWDNACYDSQIAQVS